MLHYIRYASSVTAALIFSLAMAQASTPVPSRGVTIDMPHGWWRIHIRPDGSGYLNFAALPQTGKFPAGTFDFGEVTGELAAKTTAERNVLSPSQGTIQFTGDEGGEELRYFDDRSLAFDLFERAWQSRMAPRNAIEKEQMETLARFWARREPPFLPRSREGLSQTEKSSVVSQSVRAACKAVSAVVQELAGIPPETGEGRVQEPASGNEYLGCRISATDPTTLNGEDFNLGERLREELRSRGWQEDLRYSADGAGTMSYGLRRNGVFCFFAGGAPSCLEADGNATAETYQFTVVCTDEGAVRQLEE